MRRNAVRIIGGAWRRRLLQFPDVPDLRPTPDRVKETLFNWLGQDLTGMDCLDLFAGSGSLGFEAASRGAREVVMIDKDPAVLKSLQANQATLAANQVRIVRADALDHLRTDARRYDVVFLDPPYRLGLLPEVLARLPDRLAPDARVYVESDKAPVLPECYELLRQDRAGQVHSLLIKWRQP